MKATYKYIHMMIYFHCTVFYILQRGYYFDFSSTETVAQGGLVS